MLAWTSLSAMSDENAAVMTPSNQSPFALAVLSPPVPRPMAPSFLIGLYLALGRLPSNGVVNAPVVASPSLMTQWFMPATSPFTMPVTYFQVVIGVLLA